MVGLLLSLAFAATAGGAVKASFTPAVAANVALRVELQPAVVRLRERATIAVSGLHTRSLEVLLAGATDPFGRPLQWRSLRLVDGAWLGTLPAPAVRGIYPVVLRSGAGAAPFRSHGLRLRVFAPGTRARPSFDKPAEVVHWWVRTVPHATVVALKPGPARGSTDATCACTAYSLSRTAPGHPKVRDRLGMFVTAFRDGYRASWRLLEATVLP